MPRKKYKYIYGPVPSWRLGSSLGIDPISREEKVCTFDCVYCQLGTTEIFTDKRKVFVPAEKIINEINSLPPLKIDYITFSGRGEPSLAKNLGKMITEIKKIRKEKIAVITNSSLIDRMDVREDLKLADLVMAKLDACSEKLFLKINRAMRDITFDKILKGIREFKADYKGRLALQIMFIRENKASVRKIAEIAKEIKPDEVQLNTPLRPCGVAPLSRREMDIIKGYFEDMNFISVYESERKDVKPVTEIGTLKRRGKV